MYIDNAAELAQKSNLNVDVEEFHPKNVTNYTITPPMAAHQQPTMPTAVPVLEPNRQDNNRQRRSRKQPLPTEPIVTPSQRDQEPVLNDSKRAVVNAAVEKKDTAKPQTVPQPKPSNKAAKANKSKKSNIASIRSIEEQNIDLKKSSIGAVVKNAELTNNTNQWLVQTKGKKGKIVIPIEIPEEAIEDCTPVVEETVVVIKRIVDPVPAEVPCTVTPPEAPKPATNPNAKKKSGGQAKPSAPKNNNTNNPNDNAKSKNKSKKPKAKTHSTGGFQVIEPDFGIITKLKTDPIVVEPCEYDDLLRDLDRELASEEDNVINTASASTSPQAPKHSRTYSENLIDLDDLEALERSLMDFDLTGELKERMIEILKSELEDPKPNKQMDNEEPIPNEEEPAVPICVECKEEETSASPVSNFRPIEEEIEEEQPGDEETTLIEETRKELNIITNGILHSPESYSVESSSASSSLSSPIPTDDGRDGSNSESDDPLTPMQGEQVEKLRLPKMTAVSNPELKSITDTVTQWMHDKQQENDSIPLLKFPDDPEMARKIYKAIYKVDFVDYSVSDADDDSLSELTADESDLESDGSAIKKNSTNMLDSKAEPLIALVDTDSDYMSDSQNIKQIDRLAASVASGKTIKFMDPAKKRQQTCIIM